MKKESINNWFEYIKANSLKFLSLLVILSLCSAMRFAAIGKYSTFLQDSTQVVAGESFFASNYLQQVDSIGEITVAESESRVWNNKGLGFHVTIGTWNKYDYTIPIEVRNYNNSLKFNKLDEQNTYFYIESDIFLDGDCEESALGLKDALGNPLGLRTEVSFDTESGALGQVGTIQFEENGPIYPVSLLPGGSLRTQKVNVQVKTSNEDEKVEASELFVRVAAYTVTSEDLSKISFTKPEYNYTEDTSSVFYQMLGGIFTLGSRSATANIHCEADNDEDSLKVILNVACSAMEYQATAKARVYYNSNKLEYGSDNETKVSVDTDEEIEAREKFMIDNFYHEDTSEEEKAAIMAKAANYDKYIQFEIQTASLKQFIFLKNAENDFDEDYYCFGLVIETD